MIFYQFECVAGKIIVWSYDEETAREDVRTHLDDMGQDSTLPLKLVSQQDSSHTPIVHSTIEDLT